MYPFTNFFLNCKSNVLVKRALFLLNAALAIAILRLISQVHLSSFVKMLPKYLKDSTFSSCFWSIIIFTGNFNEGIGNRNRDILSCRSGPQTQKTEPIGDRVLTELKVLKIRGTITELTRQ